MKRFLFVAGLAISLLAVQGQGRAQDEPEGEPTEDPTAEPAEGTEGGEGMEAGGEAGMEGEGEAGGDMAAAPAKPMRFGVAGIFALPLGDLADSAGIGIGVLGGVNYALSPKLALAGNLGLVYHLPKNDITLMEIPILAGVRFMVTPQIALGADTGLNLMRVSVDFMGESASETNTRIPLGIHGAFMMASGLSLGAGLWIPNLLLTEDGEDMQMELFAFVGYMF
jgi:hypothetical protein